MATGKPLRRRASTNGLAKLLNETLLISLARLRQELAKNGWPITTGNGLTAASAICRLRFTLSVVHRASNRPGRCSTPRRSAQPCTCITEPSEHLKTKDEAWCSAQSSGLRARGGIVRGRENRNWRAELVLGNRN